MKSQSASKSSVASQDLLQAVVSLHSASPSGPAREKALIADDRPFARRHGAPKWATPPIGSITGRLRASLRTRFDTSVADVYGMIAFSEDVDYARFLYSPVGTRFMLPRGVIAAANAYSEKRVVQLGRDMMNYQLSLL
jgi:hypothetical protein